MERSEQINELAKSLSNAQGIMIPASKDSNNPFFKSKYADLAAVWSVCREPLSKNGLAISQHANSEGNIVTVETLLLHTSGQWLLSRLSMTSKDSSPQAIGSCITYARRYSLSSILGIASEEDDDGNAATKNIVVKENKEIPKEKFSLRDAISEHSKLKFKNNDEFKTWRIDMGLDEDLDNSSDFQLAKILNYIKSYKKKEI